ncbi:MAG: Bifunctional ligase/repressor BirA [Syntrophus sp. PtaU1.Bin005]|jgi:BirA family biotin operon repressor/biotin-[acetyl-CoA-carboxylase] ligase|uniref:biotin--[acetyl-CoA-carboxylase] ligase n=1 Tax=Syntrophus sp. (in: bacteria) TaxID=48412 RepID=UPI0009C66646|nr:MAG: Bifunctional ligase/repressor BirA [Syntrophus sp. PtaB.Bin138]OPY80884.1 MAG: Bifunctional ligase/repressor BirA [Syntrophus sp. PtaU1.Bin005]
MTEKTLQVLPSDLNETALRERLQGRRIGRTVHVYPEIDSTNSAAFSLGHSGAEEGTVVIADSQSQGRGRLRRPWQSPPGRNLYTSILLKPPIEPAVAPQLTLLAGVAVADLLSTYCPGSIRLKWPNDVQIEGKKVCGILTEMRTSGHGIDYVVVGIGINVNIRKDDFDESFRNLATSLRDETGGRMLSRLDLAVGLYEHVERRYARYLAEGFGPLRESWLQYARIVGEPIEVIFRDELQAGEVIGLEESGALLLRDDDGREVRVLAGDATVKKK